MSERPGRRPARSSPGRSVASLRSVVALLCVFAGAGLLAAACGSDGDGAASTSNPPAVETPATDAASTDPPAAGSADSVPDGAPAVSDGVGDGVQPEGFSTVMARVTAADGEVCDVCLWLADTEAERGRGLMGVTDLGPAGGMAFLFERPTTGSFYMFQTPTPLSIAWFAEDGPWVGSAEMQPCLDTNAGACPLYSPGGASYTVAVEAFEGGLDELLMVEGSVIELLAGTERVECQTPTS